MRKVIRRRTASLAGNPVFIDDLVNGLSPEARRDLSEILRVVEFEAGAFVMVKGEPAGSFFVHKSGKSLLVIETGGGNAMTRRIDRGEIFGIPESLTGAIYDTSVVACSVCRFLSADAAELARLIQRNPEICFRILKILGTNLCKGRQILASTAT